MASTSRTVNTPNIAPKPAQASTGYLLIPASAIVGPVGTSVNSHGLRLIPVAAPITATGIASQLDVGARQIFVVNDRSQIASTSVSLQRNVPQNASETTDIDQQSLHSTIGHNKESLKRKLLQRRSMCELIAQGILPSPKTPPSFYEQRLKLERAKMGDILKHKIEHRPDKQQLVSQHILLDSCADPGIVEKQQQLKKCKLADSLNEKIASRPGPLELVQDNILHVDAALEQAIKNGSLQFKPTSAGLIQKHPQPVFVVSHETVNGDGIAVNLGISNGLVGGVSATELRKQSELLRLGTGVGGESVNTFDSGLCRNFQQTARDRIDETVAGSCPMITQTATPANNNSSKSKPKKSKAKTCAQDCGNSNGNATATAAATPASAAAKSASSKPIRLNEYTLDNGMRRLSTGLVLTASDTCLSSNNVNGMVVDTQLESDECGGQTLSETSYDLLLRQQQLLLQWQLELQQKYPNSTVQLVSLSSSSEQRSPKSIGELLKTIENRQSTSLDGHPQQQVSPLQNSPVASLNNGMCSMPQTPTPPIRCDSENGPNPQITTAKPSTTAKRLEDMKVNDLKNECKARNLPVSGSKSQVIERLKPYEEAILASIQQQNQQNLQQQQQQLQQQQQQTENNELGVNASAQASVSFLSVSNYQKLVGSPSGEFVQTSPFCGTDNRSSDSSSVASNYSSPSIDFKANCAQDCDAGEHFAFGNSNFGAHFVVTNTATNNIANQTSTSASAYMEIDARQDLSYSQQQITELSNMNSPSQPPRLPFSQALNTLTIHEEVLRQQQRKIEDLQKELQRSQELLRRQQQLILTAKKLQTEASDGFTEYALNQLDTKQIQKAHIQLFLQQKIQQQQLQQQINVQQELMEIQQKLQEEMAVQQALNEVVRLLRQEPRISILVLQLLRKHQTEQQELRQQLESAATQEQQATMSMTQKGQQKQLTHQNRKSLPSSPEARKITSEYAKQTAQDQRRQEPPATKNRQGSGPKKSPSLVPKASSVPTSPLPLKSGTVDMEEIFKSVLEHASKSAINAGETTAPEEHSESTAGTLPSFDQLMLRQPVSEIEAAITITNGGGISMTNGGEERHQLSHFVTNVINQETLTIPSETRQATADCNGVNEKSSFIYSKNEAFDDLMEVLRDNGASVSEAKRLQREEQLRLAAKQDAATATATNTTSTVTNSQLQTQQLNFLSAFGAQEIADLFLGTEWFNVDSLLNVAHNNGSESIGSIQAVDINGYGVSVVSSGQAAVASLSDGGRNSTSVGEPNDQMDWLDLILPSPVPGGVSHELPVSCMPMDVDHGGETLSCRADTLLSGVMGSSNSALTSTHNPVLAMSVCLGREAL